jgi:CRP-like cAMP-binding protein
MIPKRKNRPRPTSKHTAPPPQNLLLAKLPPEVYRRISRSLVKVPLVLKSVIHQRGKPIEEVYFPTSGFCSILTVLGDGSMVEVATVGREGMVGVSVILDTLPPGSSIAMVQAAAEVCYRMSVRAFRREYDRRGSFYRLLTRYAAAHLGFVMQSTACNAKHSVEQRLARWLLLAHDRVGKDEFPLTQEFVAMMLGASRPTVTASAGTLQRAGLVSYHRGVLRVESRARLEQASCECYGATAHLLNEVHADVTRSRSQVR